MAESSKKSLAVLKFLWEHTDENRPATTSDIIKGVAEYGVNLERHALPEIYEDLLSMGVDVVFCKSSPNKYYIGSRQLELSEVKLLIDAVDTAGFISATQSKKLINRIIDLSEPSSRKELKRHVYSDQRPKSECKELFYNVDTIHRAINASNIIRFQYYEYNTQKKRIHKHGNDYYYLVSPYALVWNDDYYYVLGYCEQHDKISKFRVDRIDNISITDLCAKSKPKDFEPVAYLKSLFSMYDGELQKVRLKCDADMMKVVIDRFGKSVNTYDAEWGKFYADVEISVSRTFFGWLFGFGGKIELVSPEDVRNDYYNIASEVIKSYRTNG